MGAFLDKPNTQKQAYDGEILIQAAPSAFAPGAAGRVPPQQYLIKFGGASMQGWRKYQEDRLSLMQLLPGKPPLCNSPIKSTVPSPPSINMIFLSVFDGHGGSDTSEYCARHFHPFLRQRVEERMLHWREQQQHQQQQHTTLGSSSSTSHTASSHASSSSSSSSSRHPKRRHSLDGVSRSSSLTLSSSALPPHPIDNEFLTRAFLDFDALIPLPSPDAIPRNPPFAQGIGMGLRRPPPQSPLGNNIPHLASGTTATVCIIDLANNHVVLAHIGDSRAVVFNSVSDLPIDRIGQKKSNAMNASLSSSASSSASSSSSTRMSPVSEEDGGSPPTRSHTTPAESTSGVAAGTASDQPPSSASKTKRLRGSAPISGGKASLTRSGRKRRSSHSNSPVDSMCSTKFLIQYHSRDHHPDDPTEQLRIQSGRFETTFLNHQPPSKSRICHTLQRISLNVVRGFGDAWFKLEESAEPEDQMVSAQPDCWFAKFPMALPQAFNQTNGSMTTTTTMMAMTDEADPMGSSSSTHSPSVSVSRRTTSASRTESPTNSRSTTPVLQGMNNKVAIPPAGETLYIILASDGIWNSEFPPNTPGVTIKHGSETATKPHQQHQQQHQQVRSTSFVPPSTASSNQQLQSATSAPPTSRPLLAHQPSITRTVPKSELPESDDEEDELPQTQTNRPRQRTAQDNHHAGNNQGGDEDDDDDDDEDDESDSSGWSSDTDDDEYPDMQVNMAVSQYFYNHAQPIINRQVKEIVAAGGHSKGLSAAAAAAGATAVAGDDSPSLFSPHKRRMVSAGRSSSGPSSPAIGGSSSASAEFGYSQLVSNSLDLLMARPPLTKQNVKSTDNMSAWLVSITPIGINQHQTPSIPVINLQQQHDDSISQALPLPISHASSLSSLPSPSRPSSLTPNRVPAGSGSNSLALLRSPASAPLIPSAPNTPQHFHLAAPSASSHQPPSIAHQLSSPAMSEHQHVGERTTSMPTVTTADGSIVPSLMSPPKLKASRQPAAKRDWSISTHAHSRPSQPSVPHFVSFIRSASDLAGDNAPTPFLDRSNEDDSPSALSIPTFGGERSISVASTESTNTTPSGQRKRRRASEDGSTAAAAAAAATAHDATPTAVKAALESRFNEAESDPMDPVDPPQRRPSRQEAVADLLFSGSTMHDADPDESTPTNSSSHRPSRARSNTSTEEDDPNTPTCSDGSSNVSRKRSKI